MMELAILLKHKHETPCRYPEVFEGKQLNLTNMWLEAWGFRAPAQPTEETGHNYRLYPLEFSHQPGVFIFGVKEDMTPQCYDPSFRIVINTVNRTYQVTDISLHWEGLIEDLAPEEWPSAIFCFC